MTTKSDRQVRDLLVAALNLQPTPIGSLPTFDAAALLPLADLLQRRGHPAADDVRELAVVRYCLPDEEPWPIACGAWWAIWYRRPSEGLYGIEWEIDEGTPQRDRVEAVWRRETARESRERLNTGAPPPEPPSPPLVTRRVYRDVFQLGYAFERLRHAMACWLVGFGHRYINDAASLLVGDDVAASACLGLGLPPRELVRELRGRDPQRFARIQAQAGRCAEALARMPRPATGTEP